MEIYYVRRRRKSWSNISANLIFAISSNLKTPTDILSFQLVCKRWRKHSVPTNLLSPFLPHPILPSQSPSNSDNIVLLASSIYLIIDNIGNSWMVMAEELNPGKIQLRHPLTGKRFNQQLLSFLDLARFRVSELAKGYNLRGSDTVKKVVVCSYCDGHCGCGTAVVLYGRGYLCALRLTLDGSISNYQFCDFENQPHHRDLFCNRNLDDVVTWKGMFYAVDRGGRLYAVHHRSSMVTEILVEGAVFGDWLKGNRKRLVVDTFSGRLFMVVRVDDPFVLRLKVFVFDETFKRWDVVGGIGKDKVLFVGVDHCFFGRVKDFPGCCGNCIVFAAGSFPQYNDSDFHDWCWFRGGNGKEDEERVGVYHLGMKGSFSLISECQWLSQMMSISQHGFSARSGKASMV